MPSTFEPLLTTRLRPVPIPSVPSVAMNELTRSRVTISPFTRPKAVPVATAAATPAAIPRPRCG